MKALSRPVSADPLPAGRQIAQDRGEALLRCAGGVGGAFDDERKYVVDVVDVAFRGEFVVFYPV